MGNKYRNSLLSAQLCSVSTQVEPMDAGAADAGTQYVYLLCSAQM